MYKKFYLIALIFIISISLSGCHIFILNKEVTTPFFEKKPEKVIDLMLGKMQNIKTVKYKSDITIKTHINMSGMKKNLLSFLGNSLNPRVLGETASVFDDDTPIEFEEDILFKSPPTMGVGNNMNMLTMPMFSPGPMDIEYGISFSGYADQSDEINPKGETNFSLNFDFGGMEIKMDGEVKVVDQKIYFKTGQLPFPFASMFGQFSDQWYELDIEKMQELQKEEMKKSGIEVDLDDFDFTKNKDKFEELEKKINKLIKDYKLINFDKRLRDEEIDNNKCYYYQVSLNKNNLNKLIEEIVKILKKEFINVEDIKHKERIMFDKIFDNPEFNSFLQKLSNIIKKAKGEIWIDKKDFYLRKATFDFMADFSDLESNKEKVETDAFSINVSGNLQYSDFNKPIKIEVPKNTKNLIDEIEKMMPASPTTTTNLPIDDSFFDFDNDGLTDGEENIYGTDASNPDTDGDGYLDGDEIKKGYNPNGEGKLDITKYNITRPLFNIKVDDDFLAGLSPSEVFMECYEAIQSLDVNKSYACATEKDVRMIEEFGGIEMFKQMLPIGKMSQPINAKVVSEKLQGNIITLTIQGKDRNTGKNVQGTAKLVKERGAWRVGVEEYNSEY
ncbi:hypothetical protein KAI92_03275 [Candidatus Parcubacteria bacterium]|nr:hypothetical protein [Candidatus Parcubacteria bacterium]